ncbi:CHAT domain-containing protein [Streptomyces sp. NPDC051366]|uniref:CHAT domain-containing protein n=1 Tax=Streptomyces sp. NPDC051366 TaxID=3365652 RepID=UPI0037A9680B
MAGRLRTVLDRHQGNRELSELLDAPALEVAQALLDLSERGEAEVRAIAVLGEFHWRRFKVLGFERGEPDFHRAQFLLQTVLQQDGDCLPEELRTEVIPGLVDGWQRIAERTSGEAPNRGEVLLGLAGALHTRYLATFRRDHLDEALGMSRAGLTVLPPGSEYRVPVLLQLENLLAHRFELAHELADLEQAIEACEEAVPLTRPGDAQRAALLSDLGMHERARFKLTGVPADLMRALDHGRRALEAVPPQSRQWQEAARELFTSVELWASRIGELPGSEGGDRATLSAFLKDLRERHGALFVIRNAIDLAESAAYASQDADASPPHDADAGLRHWAAGVGMMQRFTRNGARDRVDIEAAVRHFRAALASLPQEDLTALRVQLGGALLQRNHPEDLDEAIDLFRVVVASDPDPGSREGSQDLAAAWSNLGIALWTVVRIRAAQAAAELTAEHDPGRAADFLEEVVPLLETVALRRLDLKDRQRMLSDYSSLAADAAALALRDSRISPQERAARALVLLETGRGVLLGQSLELRRDLTRLREADPRLAGRLEELRAELGRANASAADRRRLDARLRETLVEIRAVDGFSEFGRRPSLAELKRQASDGPVVVFNISSYGSDAILVTGHGIRSLELPRLTKKATAEKFLSLLRTQPGWPDMPEPEPAQGMSDVLTWLYEAATGPVLDALGLGPVHEDDEREWPRIWWVPTGLLALLPLHAAGDHTSSGRSVLDRVVSSYTPSLTALCHARERRRRPAAHVGLIVALPQTPGPLDDLPGVAAEARVIARMIPQHLLLDSGDPAGERPEKDSVLRHLRRSTIAHFACHGGADAQDPVQSRLFLADHETEPLTVGSLLPLDLRDAQMAFLSACRTSFMANLSLLDESLHLAAAFQLVGYPYVVGTLWNVGDGAAACFAFWFYDALSTWDRNLRLEYSAHAAHRATRLLRERFADDPARWAAHVHFGA